MRWSWVRCVKIMQMRGRQDEISEGGPNFRSFHSESLFSIYFLCSSAASDLFKSSQSGLGFMFVVLNAIPIRFQFKMLILILIKLVLGSIYETEAHKLYQGSIKGYLTVPQTTKLLNEWTQKYPNLVVPAFQVGRTHLNNSIMMIGLTKIANKSPSELKKYPSTLLTSMMHSRQRSSLTMLLATFLKVISMSQQSDRMNYLLDTSVIWFVPFVNLDGVIVTDGLWGKGDTLLGRMLEYRKNRDIEGTLCKDQSIGVDLNRNFASRFGMLGITDKCNEEYPGRFAFSENQTQTIRKIFKQYHLTLVIDIHTYGNEWIHPYSYDEFGHELKRNQTQASFYKYIKKHIQKLGGKVDSCYNALGYKAAGVYIDWALENNIFSFAYEVGKYFTQPMETLVLAINQSMPYMTFMLMQNSYSVDAICTSSQDGVKEVGLRSNSLVEVKLQAQGSLYWKKQTTISNNSVVTIAPLSTVIVGFRPNTQNTVIQFTVKPDKNSPEIIYTQQIVFPSTLPACNSSYGLSDNIIIGIVIALFFLCLFGCIIISCIAPTIPQKPKIRYDVVDPQSSQVAI